jgi:hypothetical protein
MTAPTFTFSGDAPSDTIFGLYVQFTPGGDLLWGWNLTPPFPSPSAPGVLIFDPIALTMGTCSTSPPPPPPPSIYLLTDFHGTNGTNLTGLPFIIGPSGWTAIDGSFAVLSNQGESSSIQSGNNGNLYVADCGHTDFSATTTFTPMSGGNIAFEDVGFAFRVVDDNNTYVVQLYNNGGVLRLLEFNGGGLTVVTSTAFTVAAGTPVTLIVSIVGNSFSATANGVASLTASVTDFTSNTRVGIRSFDSAQLYEYFAVGP